MAVRIPVPDAPWSNIDVPLGGSSYNITFRLNERDPDDIHWRMDIYQRDVRIITGVKIVPNIPLLSGYNLDNFSHGDIVCLRRFNTKGKLPTRDNLGIDKSYELVYYTGAEILQIFT